MKKRWFISSSMMGKGRQQIEKERGALKAYLVSKGDTVIDSVLNYDNFRGIKNASVFMLGESISLLSTADCIVFIDDCYKTARGCSIEYQVAKSYGIPAYRYDASLKEVILVEIALIDGEAENDH